MLASILRVFVRYLIHQQTVFQKYGLFSRDIKSPSGK